MNFFFKKSNYVLYSGIDPSRAYTPDAMSPEQPALMTVQQIQQQRLGGGNVTSSSSSATPTMQQRIKALGIATPLAISSPVRR